MKRSLFISLLFATILIVSCAKKETHFLKNENYRNQVLAQFEKRKTEAAKRSEALFAVLEKENLSLEQKEALQFLYAYMPLCDLADYDGEFFLQQVDAAFRARDYFPWGKTVPDDIFRHFVLVYRINNEYLDTARLAFFEELKGRVKNLSMADAVLEVNHWCHEKVCYRGTDGRTSAPLALVRTSWGRCGEESTFTAAALRAVGIPARQCYTPRWVHTDDNHAWVEAWVDGKWHYIGACEPEPELDVAWFTAPAKRAMMVHTNVFGLYTGPEEKNLETPLYSKINLLENYAETRPVKVLVTDENGQPVEAAKVQFMVYNYAEFYPISTNLTDKDGKTSIISGKGDLMIWASLKDKYGYAKSNISDEVTVVKLDRRPGAAYEEQIVMNVPEEQPVKKLSPEAIANNTLRLAYEDSVRTAYMNTFIRQEQAGQFAESEKLNKAEVWKYLSAAQGNWQEIKNFIANEKGNPQLFPFLAALSQKDLRDTPAEYLSNHLQTGKTLEIKDGTPANQIVPYILSPRIESELIRPWRAFLQAQRNGEDREEARKNAGYIIDYISNNVKINEDENYYNCRITPQGVYELGIADTRSRNIFFVAACRSFGIPARIEPATGKPQYSENGNWIDVAFEKESSVAVNLPKGKITFGNAAGNVVKPGYYTHYTLAYFKDGEFRSLDLEDNPVVAGFPYTLDLDEGYYRLMVGSRANDGSVTISTKYFELKGNAVQKMEIKMPHIENKLLVKGIIDMNTVVVPDGQPKTNLKELSNGKGLMLCFVDPGKEPSKHILQDLPAVRQALEEWGGGVLFVVPGNKVSKGFDASVFKGLPRQTQWSVDDALLKAATGALQLDLGDNFPLTLYLSDNGGILFSSAGYRIGTGEEVLKIIRSLSEPVHQRQ
ncbi:MAG: transglutaminase-like domain-containing protein [Dysgonamonadaceae bacterium]|jgi:transglutaminase-like putative cysteine protease|nr:transglutaminase-like domain-containing protein [Dysgonamonadaceae bacterium]